MSPKLSFQTFESEVPSTYCTTATSLYSTPLQNLKSNENTTFENHTAETPTFNLFINTSVYFTFIVTPKNIHLQIFPDHNSLIRTFFLITYLVLYAGTTFRLRIPYRHIHPVFNSTGLFSNPQTPILCLVTAHLLDQRTFVFHLSNLNFEMSITAFSGSMV